MLNRSIKVLLYLSLLTPLLFSSSLIFPFITVKVIFFQTCIALASILCILNKNISLKNFFKNKINLLLTLFFVSLLVSSVFGVDVRYSFLGNYERSLGIMSLVYFYAFFVLLNLSLKKESWRSFIIFALIVSNLVAILGLFQYIGFPYGKNFLLTAAFGKVWSTLGNYIYLSSYALFGIFFSLHYLFQEKNPYWKQFYLSSFLLSLLSLFMGASRGPFIGFVVGLSVLILLYFVKGSRRVKINMLSLVAVLVIIFSLSYALRDEKVLKKNIPGFARFTRLDISGTGTQRLIAWGSGFKAFLEKPVLGWGNENIGIAFNKYYDPRTFELGGVYETFKDRLHNRYLDILVEQGLVGLIIWLILAGLIIYKLCKKRMYFLLALWLAYSVNLFFVFDSQATYLMMFLFLAYVSSYENLS